MARSYWNYRIEELLDECQSRGIFFDEKPDQKTMVKKLFEFDKEHGTLQEVHAEDEKGETVKAEDPEKRMVKVVFHSKDEQDIPYVFIGLNGKSFYLPRDREITIPKMLLRVIDDAIEIKITPRKAADGKIFYDERRIQRYPYSIIEE